MGEPMMKAKIVQGFKSVLPKNYGEEEFLKFINQLKPADKEIWEKKIVSVSKMTATQLKNMGENITDYFGKGNPEVFKKLVGQVMELEINAVLKIFLRIMSPVVFIGKVAEMYKHYMDKGQFVVVENKKGYSLIKLEDAQEFGRINCWCTEGNIAAGLKYTGAKNIRVEHPECKFKGGKECIFVIQYD